MEFRLPSAGRLSHLSVICATGSSGGTRRLEVWRNGAATTLACDIPSGGLSCTDDTNVVDYAAGETTSC